MRNKIILDLSRTISHAIPTYPGGEPCSLERTKNIDTHGYNDWRLTTGMHTATHIDGPGHMTNSPVKLSNYPISRFMGPGYLVDARGKNIDASLLKNMPDEPNLIVLVLTGWDKNFGKPDYFSAYPDFGIDFAYELIKRKVSMVGTDGPSPDKYPFAIHQLLLKNDILIIENLTGLDQLLGHTPFDVLALPLKLESDSALARVIAVRNTEQQVTLKELVCTHR